MVENEKGYFGSPGFDHKQVTYCLGMLLLAFAAMTLSSCASSYDDTKWSDAEVAHLETMLDPNTIGLGYEFDWIEFNSVDGAEAEWLKRTRTLPGSHTFVVETSHVTKFVGWYSGQKTNYTRQIWLLTFPVTAGSHYHIVRGYKVGEPPSVYRILTPPQRKESWLQWYSNQEKITPLTAIYNYKKDRRPSPWYLTDFQTFAYYSSVIEVYPDNVFAYCKRGFAYNEKGKYDLAVADFSRAIELDPNNADFYMGRGSAFGGKGEHDRAIADYSKAIELNPKDDIAYNSRGFHHDKKGEYDLAIADYSKAIELNSKNAIFYKNRAFAYESKGECNLAIADFSKAIKLNRNDASLLKARGDAYSKMGKEDLAAKDYSKAKAIEAKNADK